MNEISVKPSLKKSASRLGIAMVVMLALQQIAAGFAGYFISIYFPSFLSTPYGFWLLSYLPLYLVGLPVFLLIARTAPTTDPGREKIKLPLNTFIKWWFISMAAMWVFNILSVLINYFIATLKGSGIQNPVVDMAMASGGIYNLIFGVIVAPIGEELIFRYTFYKKLSGYGDKIFIFVSSLCFALMHGNLSQLLYAFVLGAIFAYILARTRNVIYCIAMHMVVNAFGMVLAPAIAKYAPSLAPVFNFAFIAITIFGIVLFIRTKKKGFIADPPVLEMPEKPMAASILNPGIILSILLGAALCIIVILSPVA